MPGTQGRDEGSVKREHGLMLAALHPIKAWLDIRYQAEEPVDMTAPSLYRPSGGGGHSHDQ
jgi:hypothetical protein